MDALRKGIRRCDGLSGLRRSLFAAILLSLVVSGATAAEEKRVALVIGNAAYRHTAALANPRHDAEDVAATLRGAGFEVIEAFDLDKQGADDMLARFARLAEDADAALVFYAGHGIQYDGQNYLIPVDAELRDEIGIRFETTRLDDVMNAFVRVRGIGILILDACRNNPFAGRLAEESIIVRDGFSRISSPRGMLVASATQADELAYDGTARNSVFTSALVAEMRVPGLEIHELMRRVAVNFSEGTEGRQLPETSSSLAEGFYLKPGETGEDAWLSLRQSADPEALAAFIARYPSSLLVDAARARLELIERSARERDLEQRLAALQREQTGSGAAGEAAAESRQRAEVAAARPPSAAEIPEAAPPQVVAAPEPDARVAGLPDDRAAEHAGARFEGATAVATRRLVATESEPQEGLSVPAAAEDIASTGPVGCAQILERVQLGESTPRDHQLLAESCTGSPN